MRGIYIHIPFCRKKCAYCDFYSVVGNEPGMAEFADLLVRELDLFRKACPDEARVPAETVFFGGGTPTALGPETLCALLREVRERFPLPPDAEVTTEINPGTVSGEGLLALRKGGFTRISIGVQSFSPEVLRTLGRIHGAPEARAAFEGARNAGFEAIGIDLIFGIPGQTVSDFRSDLETTVALGPAHISAYALSPEPGTPIQAAIRRGELALPPDETIAEMYEETRRTLLRSGYRHYEISNFARPGASCRHNLKYWRREGYLGFGPSAHGLLFPGDKAPFGLRTANPPSLEEYGRRIREGRIPWAETRVCDAEDAWKETLIAGLRLSEGVDLAEAEKRIGPPPSTVRRAVDSLLRSGKLREDGTRLRLPPELLFVSNEALRELV
jgi:oxygen-independent coproporphyrinogen-3 oxidase